MRMLQIYVLTLWGLATLAACSSVTSSPYDSNSSVEGILYKLPATEITSSATWRLTNCTPVTLSLDELQIAHRVVPDKDPANWFVIDPKELGGFWTSVDPARFELRNHMLSQINYNAASELGEVVKTGAALAARIVSGGILGLETGLLATPPTCHPEVTAALSGQAAGVVAARERLKAAREDLATVQKNLFATPSEAWKLAADHAVAQVAEARAALAAAQSGALRLSIVSTALPERGDGTLVFEPDLQPFESWFLPWPEGGNVEAWLVRQVGLQGTIKVDNPGDNPPEKPESYNGIWYRIPATGQVTVKAVSARQVRTVADVPVAQFGRIARLEMQVPAFSSRGFNVNFNESGEMQSYEATSTAIATGLITSAAAARSEVQSAVVAESQAELDRLKKQLELRQTEQSLREIEEP